ncbi:MAG TPA: HlyD family efflux transporter periplasmic adaptor subunit, partial [Bacillota bacterium]|nr:HlyD family efflux transporter periplasmic adaptor subunit [Bacillota bacterium]
VVARIGGLSEAAPEEKAKEDSGLLTALLELEGAEAREYEARSFLAAKQSELKLYEAKEDQKGAARVKAQLDEAGDVLAAAVLEREAAARAYEEKLALSKSVPSSGRAQADPGGVKMRSERPAVISYSWDGLEDTLSPANPSLLDLPSTIAAKASKGARSQGDEIEAGDVAFREIGSISTDFLLYAVGVDPELLKAGAVQKVRFTRLSSEKVTAKVRRSKVDGSGAVVAHMSIDRYVSSMTNMRAVDVELLLESHSGLIIPARAITTGEGGSYVHVLRKDKFVLIKVDVLGIVNGEAAVSSDQLRQGDKVKYDG